MQFGSRRGTRRNHPLGNISWLFARLAGVPRLYDDIPVWKTGPDAHCTAFGMVMTPSVMMTVIDMLANYNSIAVMHHNLRRNRTGTNKRCPDSRA